MKDAQFCWFAPTSGDIRYLGSGKLIEPPSIEYIVEVARRAEAAGFQHILIPVCADCVDPIVGASAILASTETLKVLIAFKPGMASPQVLGTMLNSLDNKQGRVHLNIVQGDELEAKRQGLPVNATRADLRSQLREYSHSLYHLYNSDQPVDYHGNYIHLESSKLMPTLEPGVNPPKMFIGGGRFAMELASQYYDVYLTFGDSVERIREYAKQALEYAKEQFNRDLKVGMGINIVARASREEAFEACQELISKATKEQVLKTRFYYTKNKALGGRDYKELVRDQFMIDRNVWAGMAQVRFGPVASIFGSYQEVADTLKRYYEAGITFFSLTGYPFLEEADRIGTEVLTLLS